MKTQHYLKRMLLGSFLFFGVVGGVLADELPLDGQWDRHDRAISNVYPVSASLDASTLTIQSTDRFSDITVRIFGAEGIVYEATYSAENSACIVIDLDSSLRGEYTLELTNQWGCYLVGVFEL